MVLLWMILFNSINISTGPKYTNTGINKLSLIPISFLKVKDTRLNEIKLLLKRKREFFLKATRTNTI